MKIHFYLSDQLYLIFCFFSLFLIICSYRQASNTPIWNKILQQESAVISATIFSYFFLISILDSIHIDNGQLFTILDFFFSPLNNFMEYSYSEPMSVFTFIPKVTKDDLGFHQVYPHLNYVPKYFKTNMQAHHWIIKIILLNFIYYAGAGLSLIYVLKKQWSKFSKAKRICWLTILALMYLTTIFFEISRYFHIFGTGQIGQDIFYQAVKSIRTGFFISFMTTLIILPFALSMGLMAGYFGGRCDQIIRFIYTIINSIPSVLLISASLLSWQVIQEHYFGYWSMAEQADLKLIVICLLLGLTNWASLCRFIRAEVLKLREMNYIKAAKLLGSSSVFILKNHLLPNVMHMVIISLVLDFSYFILAESVLTYIGIGVSTATISWGNMINAARLELARIPIVWWPLVTAFGFMFTVVLVCNLLADAIRKALNPKEEIYYRNH